MPQPITQNTLFYGDNLEILPDYFPTESWICDLWGHVLRTLSG